MRGCQIYAFHETKKPYIVAILFSVASYLPVYGILDKFNSDKTATPWILVFLVTINMILLACVCCRLAMDRYGYVSNNYHGQAVAGQKRVMAGGGGCQCNSHHHHRQTTHMPATQPIGNGSSKPVIINQPGFSRPMELSPFTQEGRPWTTGKCGCFEHCASCTYIASRMCCL